MDITSLTLDLAKITLAFLGTLFIGVPIWLKCGRHWTLRVTLPLAAVLTFGVRNELPLVTAFSPEVIIALVLAHVAVTGLIAALIYPSTKARLKKEMNK